VELRSQAADNVNYHWLSDDIVVTVVSTNHGPGLRFAGSKTDVGEQLAAACRPCADGTAHMGTAHLVR